MLPTCFKFFFNIKLVKFFFFFHFKICINKYYFNENKIYQIVLISDTNFLFKFL